MSAPNTPIDPNSPPPPLTVTQWLIVVLAAIGFAFDIYELLMLPLIVRPAIEELVPGATLGTAEFGAWRTALFVLPAFAGGIFGLLGGYLTDLFGRRRVLTWSILLYAFSAFAAGFSTSIEMLLFLRCLTFIGFCVEFVAAVAWVSETFAHPKQREQMLGYTQAFSSVGGLLVAIVYGLIVSLSKQDLLLPIPYLPEGFVATAPWRYTLMSGVLPAVPLILIRPFLPESQVWLEKKQAGTLKRPSVLELFRKDLWKTTVLTTIMVGCTYGAALGALQFVPQLVPELAELNLESKALTAQLKDLKTRATQTGQTYEALAGQAGEMANSLQGEAAEQAQELAKIAGRTSSALQTLRVQTIKPLARDVVQLSQRVSTLAKDLQQRSQVNADELVKLAASGQTSAESLVGIFTDEEWARIANEQKDQQDEKKNVQVWQEVGGLLGRFIFAMIVIYIVSRRLLLRIFQVPAMIILPLVFVFTATSDLFALKVGIFFVGLFAVAQLSFWGNYLPRVYPTHLRGTGEGFAANIGGRALGTSFVMATQVLTGVILSGQVFGGVFTRAESQVYAAAAVGFGVYIIAFILSFFLPEPGEEDLPE